MRKITYIMAIMFTLNCIAQEPNFLEHTIFLSGNPNVNNYFNSVTLQMDLIPGNNEITRPFIVAEGFDPGHVINPDEAYGDLDITDFDDELGDAGNALRDLIDIDNPVQSYDVIYINWNNGTGNIKDNSKLLEKVLDWVNDTKVLDATGVLQQNVLLGQSMGGVIGKYTLARMEQEDPNFNPSIPSTSPHDVRLFIAHDAPLQGSNTAISTQHFSRHMLNFYIETPVAYFLGENAIPAVYGIAELGSSILNLFGANTSVDAYVSPQDYLTIQDTPAAVQMNYYWVNYNENAISTIHDRWQQQFEAMGYPRASRNIAISNGNECAADQGFTPGDLLLQIDDLDNPDFFGDIVHMLGTFLGGAPNGQVGLAILGILPGSSKWFYNFNLHATPSSGSGGQTVYYGRVSYEKKLLWLIKTTINVTLRNKNAPNGILPYDSFSGGSFDVNNILDDLPSQLPALIVHNDAFGFIPVVSALDIKRDNAPAPLYADYLKTYAGGSVNHSNLSTSFDNFSVDYQPNQFINNDHISFQRRNGDWLEAELTATNIQFNNCSFICDIDKISGPNSICNSGTYSVSNGVPVYNWSIIEGSYFASISGSGSTITLNQTGSNSGYVTIQLTFGDNFTACGNRTITKRVFVGTPNIDYVTFTNGLYEEGYFCTSHTNNKYNLSPGIQGNTYQYRILGFPNLNVLYTSPVVSGNSGTVYYTPSPGWYVFEARMTNSCGTSNWFGTEVEFVDCRNGGGGEGKARFAVFPNPSSEEVNISYKSKNSLSDMNVQSDNISRLRLYDYSGNVIIEKNNGSLKKLNITRAKKGLYFLEITSGENSEMHKVVVEK